MNKEVPQQYWAERAIGELDMALSYCFLTVCMQGAMVLDSDAERQLALAIYAAMGDGYREEEWQLAVICHEELCSHIRANMRLDEAVKAARFSERGKAAFSRLLDRSYTDAELPG